MYQNFRRVFLTVKAAPSGENLAGSSVICSKKTGLLQKLNQDERKKVGELFLFFLEFDVDGIFLCIPVGHCLYSSDFCILPAWLEQVTEPFLGL
jgi:hypothetical protein